MCAQTPSAPTALTALTAPTALSASSTPTALSASPQPLHVVTTITLTAPTAHRLHSRSSAIVPTWPPLVRVFESSIECFQCMPNPPPPSPPSALRPPPPPSSLRPATLRRHHHHPHCPHRSPPSASAIVPTWPPLVRVFESLNSV